MYGVMCERICVVVVVLRAVVVFVRFWLIVDIVGNRKTLSCCLILFIAIVFDHHTTPYHTTPHDDIRVTTIFASLYASVQTNANEHTSKAHNLASDKFNKIDINYIEESAFERTSWTS